MSRCCDRLENRSISFGVNAVNLESRAGAPRDVAKLVQTLGQFVAIDFRAVVDCAEHIARLQRLPTPFRPVPSGVEQDEVRVQLRVKGARGGMQEGGTDEVAGDAVAFRDAPFANPCGGELFQFPHGQP